MIFLPIVERELRVAARLSRLYWGRTSVAAGALVVGGCLYKGMQGEAPSMIGQILFNGLGWLAFLSCLMAGARLTADCLSEERREGTLGLLFLTDLRGYDVIAGKLVSASLHAAYQLLAVFPVLTLSLLFGGIEPMAVARVVGLLVATLLLSLAVGLAVSVGFVDGRKASVTTALILLAWAAGPWLLLFLWIAGSAAPTTFAGLGAWHAWLNCSPATALVMAQWPANAPGIPTQWSYRVSLAIQIVVALAALGWASWRVPHVWQDRPAARDRPSVGGGGKAQRERRCLLDVNPFTWLATRGTRRTIYVWLVLGGLALTDLAGGLRFGSTWRESGGSMALLLLAHMLIKAWVAVAASRQLADDRSSGALELILSTPTTPEEIVRGQLGAVVRQLAPAVAAVLLADLWVCHVQLEQGFSDRVVTLLLFLGLMALLVADAFALVWTGMWAALTSRGSRQAAVRALWQVMIWPWPLTIGAVLLHRWLGLGRLFELSGGTLFALWLGAGLAVDAWLVIRTRTLLHSQFRVTAAAGRPPRSGGWRSWWRLA